MWSMLLRLVNAAEMRMILAGFVASSVLQGVTLALMIPFLRALYGRSESLTAWLIVVVALGALTVLVDAVAMYRSYRVSVFEVCDTMIDRVAEHVLSLPLGWFDAGRRAAVVNATSKEVNTLSHLTSLVIPSLCNAFIVPLVMLVATAFVEWPLALIMAITIVPLALTWRLMLAATTRANEMGDSASADAAGRLVEFARLQAVLRATGATEAGWDPLRATLDADSEATLAGLRIKGRPAQAFNLIVNLAFALVMAAGLSAVSGHGLDVVAGVVVGGGGKGTARVPHAGPPHAPRDAEPGLEALEAPHGEQRRLELSRGHPVYWGNLLRQCRPRHYTSLLGLRRTITAENFFLVPRSDPPRHYGAGRRARHRHIPHPSGGRAKIRKTPSEEGALPPALGRSGECQRRPRCFLRNSPISR